MASDVAAGRCSFIHCNSASSSNTKLWNLKKKYHKQRHLNLNLSPLIEFLFNLK